MYSDSVEYAILREDWERRKVTPVNWNDEDFDKKLKTIGQDVKHSVYTNAISFSKFCTGSAGIGQNRGLI
jgi:hypothetical protein